jgi:hypothetical protein
MRRSTPLLVLAALLAGAAGAQEAANPYQAPLKPAGFEARAVAVPPVAPPGQPAPAAAHLGVEIRVQVADYLPRALEPTLVIDGEPIEARTRIVAVEGAVTTLGFLVETPERLKDGASLAVQMGEDETTRAPLPAVLRLEEIRPLDPAEAKEHGLPDLESWLSPPDAPP